MYMWNVLSRVAKIGIRGFDLRCFLSNVQVIDTSKIQYTFDRQKYRLKMRAVEVLMRLRDA